MDTVDLKRYLSILLRWWWLLILATVLASLTSYRSLRHLPPTYISSTTILVGDIINNPNPTGGDFSTAQSLAEAYAQIAQQQPILEATVKALRLPLSWEQLKSEILVVHAVGSQTIEIRVVDTDPRRARDLAGEIARQLVDSSPTVRNRQDLAARRVFISGELDDLQGKIAQAKAQEDKIRAEMSKKTSAREVLDLQDELKAVDLNVNSWQSTYATLLKSLEGGNGPNDLTIIDPASLPVVPAGPKIMFDVVLAGLAGLSVAALGILAIEYLDDTVRTREDLATLLEMPVLGAIESITDLGKGPGSLVVLNEPGSAAAECYRTLVANLRLAVSDRPNFVILVTSAAPHEGKSTTSANLAIALAHSGKRVLLIDFDVWHPCQNEIFDVPNERGIHSMLLDPTINPAECVVSTRIDGVLLLPSGPMHQGSTGDQVASRHRLINLGERLISDLRSQADLIIIDTPPILAASDTSILARSADGTILVSAARQTRRDAVRTAVEAVKRTRVTLLGSVLNFASRSDVDPYGYRYSSKKRHSRLRFGWFGRGKANEA